MKRTLLAAVIATFGTGSAFAGCNFYEHNEYQGASFGMSQGCAVLVGNDTSGCEGLAPQFMDGWNDKISSVQITNGSKAYLKQHGDGSGTVGIVQGTSAPAVPGHNDEASVVLCRYE